MLILVGMQRYFSCWILAIIIPMLGIYMRIMSGIQGRIGILESHKKGTVLGILGFTGIIYSEIVYILRYIYVGAGLIGAIYIGSYVFMIMICGLWFVLRFYVLLNWYIVENYKLMSLRMLPLAIFFVKIGRSIRLLWIVMIMAINTLLQ